MTCSSPILENSSMSDVCRCVCMCMCEGLCVMRWCPCWEGGWKMQRLQTWNGRCRQEPVKITYWMMHHVCVCVSLINLDTEFDAHTSLHFILFPTYSLQCANNSDKIFHLMKLTPFRRLQVEKEHRDSNSHQLQFMHVCVKVCVWEGKGGKTKSKEERQFGLYGMCSLIAVRPCWVVNSEPPRVSRGLFWLACERENV